MSLRSIISKLKALQKFDTQAAVIEIINENKEYIIYLLQHQMSEGIDGDGAAVKAKYGAFYADETERQKKELSGLAGVVDVVTNYMSGDFYASLSLKTKSSKDFVFSSSISYFEEIIKRSGDSIMRLNKEYSSDLKRNIINPQLKIKLKKFQNGL